MLSYNKKHHGLFCNNCGRCGHAYKRCRDPITSYGVLCLKWADLAETGITPKGFFDCLTSRYASWCMRTCVGGHARGRTDEPFAAAVRRNLRVLLIRRMHTLNYVQLVRGKYEVGLHEVRDMLKRLTKGELAKVRSRPFRELWEDIWRSNAYKSDYAQELDAARAKFDSMMGLVNGTSGFWEGVEGFDEAEWGFPKGRRNHQEGDLACALREFHEETGVSASSITVLSSIHPVQEDIIGSNGFPYRYHYFMAVENIDANTDIDSGLDRVCARDFYTEVSAVRWASIEEAERLLRPYNTERKAVLNIVLDFIMDSLRPPNGVGIIE